MSELEPWETVEFRGTHANSGYLFNFRDETDREECNCPDRASWPTPRGAVLQDDPFAQFIKEYRAWKEQGGG